LLTQIATESGPVAANRVRSSISSIWALKAGRAEANPAAFTNKEHEKPRARVVTAAELRQIWAALPQGDFGTIAESCRCSRSRLIYLHARGGASRSWPSVLPAQQLRQLGEVDRPAAAPRPW